MQFNRIALIVLDSVGIGAMPDAEAWGDVGADTLGHILEHRALHLPQLVNLSLAHIRDFPRLAPAAKPMGSYGRCALLSNGKDTTTGHWELAGIILDKAFPTYPNGFPDSVVNRFTIAANVGGVLGNCAASGTDIIRQLGAEHIETGKPIVYTSADSVFQIAAHEAVIPIEKLYAMCESAREILQGEHQVGRVIARPFIGEKGNYQRTERRKDYAIPPPRPHLNHLLSDAGYEVLSVGKVSSVFCDDGFTRHINAKNNLQAVDGIIHALSDTTRGLIFANLVDFDMLYGHRRDVEGYARALEDFDKRLPHIIEALRDDDLLVITADHGNDPAFKGTDHTREYTPLLVYNAKLQPRALATRRTLADIGQTIAANFGVKLKAGESFQEMLTERLPR